MIRTLWGRKNLRLWFSGWTSLNDYTVPVTTRFLTFFVFILKSEEFKCTPDIQYPTLSKHPLHYITLHYITPVWNCSASPPNNMVHPQATSESQQESELCFLLPFSLKSIHNTFGDKLCLASILVQARGVGWGWGRGSGQAGFLLQHRTWKPVSLWISLCAVLKQERAFPKHIVFHNYCTL